MPLLAASILSADFGRLEAHAREAIEAGADWLHIDVMDGRFVPNITIGPLVLASLKPLARETGALLDVHLMIEEPERYIDAFATAGADILTVHVEACRHVHRTIQQIREAGVRPGITLNPGTSLHAIEEVLADVDLVLIMSVNPGFANQSYLPGATRRIEQLRRTLDRIGSTAHLEVDGGVKPDNAREIAAAGADVIVAGSAVFGPGSVADHVAAFRRAWTYSA